MGRGAAVTIVLQGGLGDCEIERASIWLVVVLERKGRHFLCIHCKDGREIIWSNEKRDMYEVKEEILSMNCARLVF